MMKWVLLLILGMLLLSGCGKASSTDGSDTETGSETGTGLDDGLGSDSSSGTDSGDLPLCMEGETQCAGTMIQRCASGAWKDYDDCAVSGQICGLSKGTAICYSSGGTDSTDEQDLDTLVSTEADSETDFNMPPDTDTLRPKDTNTVPNAGCGDGVTGGHEACDDGNTVNGDGCRGDCLEVEEGWLCTGSGVCQPVSRCGDGAVNPPEMCDDGNNNNGDGCSALCKLESGWQCDVLEPSACVRGKCGDGTQAAGEACDDGNRLPFDGCDMDCQMEPNCAGGECVPVCGDGIVQGSEECDDANKMSGDGCSAACQVEVGFNCDVDSEWGESVQLAVIYRDFEEGDVDFEQFQMTENELMDGGCQYVSTGMVSDTLNSDGKPVWNASYGNPSVGTNPDECNDIQSSQSFAAWFAHSENDASVVPSTLRLWKNHDGEFVNRWLPDGTQWSRILDFEPEEPDYQALWCGEGGDNRSCDDVECAVGEEFDPDSMLCFYPCEPWDDKDMSCAVRFDELDSREFFDGNPVFFPIDGQGVDNDSYEARIPEQVYEGMKIHEESFLDANDVDVPNGYDLDHNFFFTSELRFHFRYDGGGNQRLQFVGDDDVWVFVNNKLAIDLGGIHVPVDDTISIQSLAASHNLENGGVYEIALFHANRRRDVSTFRLALWGLDSARSACQPTCGDGILALGEQCDDGANNGGYNGCNWDCTLDEYCGDGIVQGEYEHCDDGNFINGDACPANCRLYALP